MRPIEALFLMGVVILFVWYGWSTFHAWRGRRLIGRFGNKRSDD